jgi:hypothetical protein
MNNDRVKKLVAKSLDKLNDQFFETNLGEQAPGPLTSQFYKTVLSELRITDHIPGEKLTKIDILPIGKTKKRINISVIFTYTIPKQIPKDQRRFFNDVALHNSMGIHRIKGGYQKSLTLCLTLGGSNSGYWGGGIPFKDGNWDIDYKPLPIIQKKKKVAVDPFKKIIQTKTGIEGVYLSNLKSIKVKKSKSNVVFTSGRKTPTQIKGNFFVSKHNTIGFVVLTDLTGTYTIPTHLIGEKINQLLRSKKLTHYENYPTECDDETKLLIAGLIKKV